MRRVAGSVVIAVLAVATNSAEAQTYDPQGQKLVGRIHDANRAARQRQELSLGEEVDRAHVRYAKAKKEIEDTTGINFSMEASFMSQWGTPDGGYGAVQAMFTPAVNWDVFSSPTIGDGSVQFHFMAAQYLSGASGASLGSNITSSARSTTSRPPTSSSCSSPTPTASRANGWRSRSASTPSRASTATPTPTTSR